MRKKLVIIVLILISIFVFSSCTKEYTLEEQYNLLVSNKLPTDAVHATFSYGESNMENVTAHAENVFVGKVKSYTETIVSENASMPHTLYTVEVIKNLKGYIDTSSDIVLRKSGGLSKDFKKKLIFIDDNIPKLDEYYIFSGKKNRDGQYYCEGGYTSIKIENKENYKEDSEYKKVVIALEEK